MRKITPQLLDICKIILRIYFNEEPFTNWNSKGVFVFEDSSE